MVEKLSPPQDQALSLCDVYSLPRRAPEYPPCQIFQLHSHPDQEEHSQFVVGYGRCVDVRSVVNRGGNDGSLFWFEFVYLLNVNCETSCCVQATGTHVTLEMLCFLVLHENFVVVQVRMRGPCPARLRTHLSRLQTLVRNTSTMVG